MPVCEDCGDDATREWDHGEDYAFWTRQPRRIPVCGDCWTRLDNREGPDPSGEPPMSLNEQCERAWEIKHGYRR